MKREEVDLVVSWAASEGWNPGRFDAQVFYETDPDGFFLGLLDGEPVGGISAVSYGDRFGFIGLFIIKPGSRGSGYGLQLGLHAVNHLGSRIIGLDGVVEQQENYKRSGFKLVYRNIRFRTQGGSADDSRTRSVLEVPFSDLEAYDAELFSVARPHFLKAWITQPESKNACVIEGGKLRGYGVARTCLEGCKIGPLFADTPEIAERLFLSLRTFARADQPVFLDVPEPNQAALALVERYGMEKVFETARMYKNGDPQLDVSRIYGVTTFELG